jgi:hypothetical protein
MAGFSRRHGSESGDPYLPICEELHTLLSRKRGYYGCAEEDPLQNAMGVQEQGISPWVYQLARIGEKVRRLGGLREALVNGDAQVFNQVQETLKDIAGHAVVALAVLQKEFENESFRD